MLSTTAAAQRLRPPGRQQPAGQRQQPARQWHRRQQQRSLRPPCPQAQQQAQPTAGDPLAQQRAELGRRVVRHVSGAQPCEELASAVKPLPLLIHPPRAWAALTDGVATHGPGAFRAALNPRRYSIPRFGTLAHCRCELTASRSGRRFRARPLNLMLACLFEQIPSAVALAGLPPIHLNRFDLYHGHIFYAPACHQLGLLLHAREHPAACAERFPVNLGNCQAGSPLEWDDAAMDHRNLLWVNGRLASLDVSQPALQPLLMPGLELARTVLEHDLGQPLADANFFAELQGRKPAERLFVCIPGD